MKTIFRIFTIISFLIIALIATFGYKVFFKSNTSFSEDFVYVYINSGSSQDEMISSISSYIIDVESFIKAAKTKKYLENIKAGRFIMHKGDGNNKIINSLRSKNIALNITFNNIQTIQEFSGYISKKIEADSMSLIESFTDENFLKSLNLTQESVLSLFLPNTYEFFWNTSADNFREKMVREFNNLWNENRIEKVLVLNGEELTGLVTMKDIEKSEKHPNATKDEAGQLRVGAAIGTGAETMERAKALYEAGVDLFVIDSAHGHSKNVVETIKAIKKEFSGKDVIAGNVATPEGAEALIAAGADSVKIGMGPGSICTTRIIAGIGVPQISAILSIYEKVKGKVPLIADGGMRYSGDIAKAIAAGADCVMLGSIFAGTEEAPGEFELYQGRSFKTYRGMGSLGAMSKRDDTNRYFQEDVDAEKLVPEGVEGRVPYKGWAINVINQLVGGLRQSMGYVGCKNIREMKENSKFVEITNAGMTESHVHDVQITKEAPNYQRS